MPYPVEDRTEVFLEEQILLYKPDGKRQIDQRGYEIYLEILRRASKGTAHVFVSWSELPERRPWRERLRGGSSG